VSWTVLFTKLAQKDARKLASASPALKQKAQALLDLLSVDPYQQPPPYEALVGELRGACSRRINIQHRLVYQVMEEEGSSATPAWSPPHPAGWRAGSWLLPPSPAPWPLTIYITNPRAGWRPARQPQLSDLNGAVLCRQGEIQANPNPLARIAPGQQVNGGGTW
jgi:toxin YoeB